MKAKKKVTNRNLLIAGLVLAGVVIVVLATQYQASLQTKGGRYKGTLTVPDGVFGGTTTATASAGTWVQARCYQNGVLVYGQGRKLDEAGQAVLTLGPTGSWTGGAANCTAEAGNYTRNNSWRITAITTFNVAVQ